MSDESAQPADAKAGALTAAREKIEKHPVGVLVGVAVAAGAVAAAVVIFFTSQQSASDEKRHAAELAELRLAKLQATPLSTPDAPGAADAITTWLKSGNPRERIDALRIIGGNRNREPFFVPVIAALLADGDPKVRATAATALGMMQDKAGVVGERITPLLRDESAEVRKAAVAALGASWQGAGDDAFPDLARLFTSPGESIRLRSAAGQAMLIVDDERGRAILERQLEYPLGSDPHARCAALFALANPVMGAGGMGAGGIAARQDALARSALRDCVDALALFLEEEDPRFAMTSGDYGPYLALPAELPQFADARVADLLDVAAAKAPRGRVRATLAANATDIRRRLEVEERARRQTEKASKAGTKGGR